MCRFIIRQPEIPDSLGYDLIGALASCHGASATPAFADRNHHKVFDRWAKQSKFGDVRSLLLLGHMYCATRTFKHALYFYTKASQVHSDPLITFCVAIAALHLVMNRKTENCHWQALETFAMLDQYRREREGENSIIPQVWRRQETLYNLARACQMLGLNFLAEKLYRSTLEVSNQFGAGSDASLFDLKHESAYNLANIYWASGANDLAATVIEQYNTI
jgi:hypothetical protein